MKKVVFIFFTICFFGLNLKANDSSQVNWKALPKQKLVQTFTADSRANRMSFARNFDENSYNASMGGIQPIVGLITRSFKGQLSAAGSTYLTLKRNEGSGSVINTDFFAELFSDLSLHGNWLLRLGTGHTSQHLSDDAIVNGIAYTNYAKDYHYGGLVYRRDPWNLQAYGLTHYNYNFKTQTDLSGKWMFQFGFEHAPLHLNGNLKAYYAGDIKLKQELNFDPTINAQIGLKWGKAGEDNLRLAFDQTWGKEERGSFMYQNRNFSRLAIYFDF